MVEAVVRRVVCRVRRFLSVFFASAIRFLFVFVFFDFFPYQCSCVAACLGPEMAFPKLYSFVVSHTMVLSSLGSDLAFTYL